MRTDQTTRFTALGAIVLASLALGVSLVSLGCQRKSDLSAEQLQASEGQRDRQTEGARMPSEPLVEADQAATVPTVQKLPTQPAVAATPAAADNGQAAGAPGSRSVGAATGVSVKRLVMTNAIEDREPAQVEGFRSGGGPVVAFIEAQNALDESQKIVVTFEHASGTKVGFVKLEIPEKSTRWRTWARSTHINKVGEWTAVVRSFDGQELARQQFSVQG
jgi:hypothetical protein